MTGGSTVAGPGEQVDKVRAPIPRRDGIKQRFTRRSFGTFQEQPVDAVLRFDARVAADVAEFLFHPEQP